MLWILQDNLHREVRYQQLVGVLDRLGLPHMVVKPVPFTNRLIPIDFDVSRASVPLDEIPEPNIPTNQPIMVSGSYTLARISIERGWKPGAFLHGLRYDEYAKGWGHDRLLNPGALVGKMRDAIIPKGWKAAFVKPVEDSKAFSGRVFGRGAFEAWKQQIVQMTNADVVTGDTEVIVSQPRKIFTETRLWVVDGQVVTASGYKVGERVTYSDVVEEDIIEFGRQCVGEWQPNRAFVLDIARTPDGLKIVEVNNLNSAGLYAADVQKLVVALEEMATHD